MHMAGGGGMHKGGRGDARASCASPLGTPLQAYIYSVRDLIQQGNFQTSCECTFARISLENIGFVPDFGEQEIW